MNWRSDMVDRRGRLAPRRGAWARCWALGWACCVAGIPVGAWAQHAVPGAAAGTSLVASQAHAHPSGAQPPIRGTLRFDTNTWAQLLAQGPRPAAYVFSTTHCPTCPLAFEALHDAVRASGQRVELAAVVMDAQGPQALAHLRHYSGVTRAYAFDGFEPEIRHSVDPKWRNVTPYVVLVDRQGRLQRFTGQPQAAQLQAWLP
ncbi:MAG: TlpA family protein disulfide reductase [Rhodoferax sp.]